VMIWGGASDGLFTSACVGKNFKCFGTFTTASQYMATSLEALDLKFTAKLKVAFIQNPNPFSADTCKGAADKVRASSGSEVIGILELSSKDSVSEADLKKLGLFFDIDAADVFVICGHNGFVEPVAISIGTKLGAGKLPKAIIGSNLITTLAKKKFDAKSPLLPDFDVAGLTKSDLMTCLLQPTQWARGTAQDPVVGWTSSAFSSALGENATYHAASAGAAGVAIANAMQAAADKSQLVDRLAALDIASFYGPIKFSSNGAIQKPMYAEQRQAGANHIVAPSADKKADIQADLTACAGWKDLAVVPAAADSC